jgi:Mg2+-importing ATPase
MVSIGPISSVFDFLTFFVLLHVFHAGAEVFHTGWFVESLATQTLVLLVIRTQEAPWRSRPSGPLLASVFVVVAVGAVLPMIAPVAKLLGFAPLPAGYAAFVAAATVAYLGLVEIAKRVLARRRPAADQDPVGPVVAPSPAGTVVR